jgi:hypothetical protein
MAPPVTAPAAPKTHHPHSHNPNHRHPGPGGGQQALAAISSKQQELAALWRGNAAALQQLAQHALGFVGELDAIHSLLQQLVGSCVLQEQPKIDAVRWVGWEDVLQLGDGAVLCCCRWGSRAGDVSARLNSSAPLLACLLACLLFACLLACCLAALLACWLARRSHASTRRPTCSS